MRPVCLLTGSAGRLGSALYQALIATHDVASVYRSQLPRFPSQLRVPIDIGLGRGKRDPTALAYCIQGDVTKSVDISRIVEVTLARFGRIDVVINSAADTRYHGKLLELHIDDLAVRNQLLTNCIAPISLTSAIFQSSWKNERQCNRDFNRCVINISSISALYVHNSIGQGYYSASKAALNLLTQHLAVELGLYGVRANCVCPSRFPDTVPVETVVRKILQLISSEATGQIVEMSRGPRKGT
jgi:NAD(P)-dependent dehydrogenase (short-subunit alcohol dehydrogenase family)